ncbi:MAG: hypothetical protein ACFFCV_18595 [Promethearchaeota archaeon]
MEEFKPISNTELEELISKILCSKFGFCPTETEIENTQTPNKCVPVLKVGENYIQYDPSRNAYKVWAKDGTYFGIAKSKSDACRNLEPYKDGKYYGLK